jgi:activator of 2-hydroxyglutaryl-CoA dehydratase
MTCGGDPGQYRILVTGSGGRSLAAHIGARFVQEVNAVSLAVEERHPEAGSAIELGGQDAKILIFHQRLRIWRQQEIHFHE